MQEPQCLVFGPFRLDLRDERLWWGEAAMHLHPKTLAVLRALVAESFFHTLKTALISLEDCKTHEQARTGVVCIS
jgi:hypothetical protein